jgi:cytochrome c biogenesis protein CcmG/thiol:disulfide interchange protein DsbE
MTNTADTDPSPPPAVSGLRKTRKVLWIAVAVAVPVALLVLVLANGQPATTRAVKSPLVGKPAPAIEGTTVDGTPASLAGLEGRWVVVNFFATWCVPCRNEHPELVRFSEAHQAAGDAAVLGVVYSDNAQAVKEFRDKEGGAWPMLVDNKGRIALDYGVAGVPESFLVSPEGLVVAKLLGGVRAGDLDQLLYQARTGR